MRYLDRDVEIVSLNQTQSLVVSCDSCGSIGMKDLDSYKISWSITGGLTTRVALLEVLSTGAVPKLITVAISNEPHPAGEMIMEGVKKELLSAGLSDLPIAISTEKNMPTRQTGLGVSVIGVMETDQLRIGKARRGDAVCCLGLPKVGAELSDPEDPEIVHVGAIHILLDMANIYDIIPVGSRGIRLEAEQLATAAKGQLHIDQDCSLDLDKSAGPSTCLLFSAGSEDVLNQLQAKLPNLPINKIGILF